jgi:hypothetical protein
VLRVAECNGRERDRRRGDDQQVGDATRTGDRHAEK